MSKIEDKIEEVEQKINEADPETDLEAKKRQKFMPTVGAIVAAVVLFGLLAYFAGLF